jgi:peptidyl-prolyl cis-trans isomerase D
VAHLKPEFDTTKDVTTFLASKGSLEPTVYAAPAQLPASVKDSILKLAKDQVFGPYLDGGNYVLAKLLEARSLPDSVKCRHILLGTQDRSGNPIMDDSTAHKRADSIALAIKNGANFDTLETKFTTDEAAHRDKGVMTFSSATIQGDGFAKEFGDFILIDGKPGDKKVVKTQFGWHYIEIMSFIKPTTQYKVAYLKQEVIASQQTDDNASQEATNFSGAARDPKSFDTAFEKTYKAKGYNKTIAANIKRNDGQVQGMTSRNLVRNIYSAKQGDVLKPEPINVGNYKVYVVAVVTETLKEGTLSVDKARASIEPLLRNKKKAAMLKQKAGSITTLEAASAALGKPIETVDSLRMKTGAPRANFSNEPKVYGATFNPANKGKVVPEVLEGISGVYVVRVNSVSATPSTSGSTDQQRKEKYDQAKQAGSNYLIDALKKAATIKDKRSDTY